MNIYIYIFIYICVCVWCVCVYVCVNLKRKTISWYLKDFQSLKKETKQA